MAQGPSQPSSNTTSTCNRRLRSYKKPSRKRWILEDRRSPASCVLPPRPHGITKNGSGSSPEMKGVKSVKSLISYFDSTLSDLFISYSFISDFNDFRDRKR